MNTASASSTIRHGTYYTEPGYNAVQSEATRLRIRFSTMVQRIIDDWRERLPRKDAR